MYRSILILVGHPTRASFCRALGEAYRQGAAAAGHSATLIDTSELIFDPILHCGYHAEQPLEPDLAAAQDALRRADHLVLIYPLWQGFPPALLKGFFERVLTRGFAYDETKLLNPGRLMNKSARVIVTMGMPGVAYRFVFGAHSYRALKRNTLHFCGIRPVRASFFGLIAQSAARRQRYLKTAEALGRRAL